MVTIAIVAILLGGVAAYRRLIPQPLPGQPKPELVAWGITPLSLWLPLLVIPIMVGVVAWKWRGSR
jgi:hypothetical protein